MSKSITIVSSPLANAAVDLVYETDSGSIMQCDQRGTFLVRFYDEVVELKLCGLLAFRKKLNRIDLSDMFAVEAPQVEVIYLPHCDRLFAFSLVEILALKDLMEGAMAILHLNSMIHRETIRRPAFLSRCA